MQPGLDQHEVVKGGLEPGRAALQPVICLLALVIAGPEPLSAGLKLGMADLELVSSLQSWPARN